MVIQEKHSIEVVRLWYEFSRADTYMVEYLSMFYGKSFQLKPFEFTGFSDTAMIGYDQNKIAFLFNKDEYRK